MYYEIYTKHLIIMYCWSQLIIKIIYFIGYYKCSLNITDSIKSFESKLFVYTITIE
jgi:hypothetical protein